MKPGTDEGEDGDKIHLRQKSFLTYPTSYPSCILTDIPKKFSIF